MLFHSLVVLLFISKTVVAATIPFSKLLENYIRQEKSANAATHSQMNQLPSDLTGPLELRPIYGWKQVVDYKKSDCTYPLWKSATVLDQCGNVTSDYGASAIISAQVDGGQNQYSFETQYYSDYNCEKFNSYSKDFEKILICQYNQLVHVTDYPLNATTDNLGFAIGVYTNQQDCTENSQDDYQGLLEYYYQRINYCYNDGVVDYKITSCSSTAGFTYSVYSSTDGSCSGTAQNYAYTPSQMCTEGNWSLETFTGYPNYVCANTA